MKILPRPPLHHETAKLFVTGDLDTMHLCTSQLIEAAQASPHLRKLSASLLKATVAEMESIGWFRKSYFRYHLTDIGIASISYRRQANHDTELRRRAEQEHVDKVLGLLAARRAQS